MKKSLAVLILLAAAALTLAAQDTKSPGNPSGQKENSGGQVTARSPTIRSVYSLVNLLFPGYDKKNRMVVDLPKDDVSLIEDKKPQSIQFFSRESDLPLRIGILVDTSNSVRDR